ncbi:alpha/beta fold hydrolase [Serratia sp. NPDC078593]|uniref:alpha/beta fold hydrolase n=1 Tax=unclassified Serratia (in: enterobacteria) TaxID=2647522 RepID=UPI0037D43F70
MFDSRRGFLRHSSMRRIFYYHYTKSNSVTTLLMIHGFAEASFIWSKTAQEAASKFNCDVIAIDLSGHGRSDWRDDGNYNIANYADDVEFVINELNINSLILIGHSMGGRIANELLKRKVSGVCGMVMVDFCPKISGGTPSNYVARNFEKSVIRSWSIDEYAGFISNARPLMPGKDIKWLAAELLVKMNGSYFFHADPRILNRSANHSENETSQTRACSIPISIIRGYFSSFVSEHQAQDYLRDFKFSKYYNVPKSGHGLVIENNSGFNMALYDFMQMIPGIEKLA